MANEHVLLIEDDEDIRELVRYNLEKEGYAVSCAESGEIGMNRARTDATDLVILDIMLPGVDGLTVCRNLKVDQATRKIPVIMLTAKSDDADIVTGLEVGADDYVTKPFSPRVLLARIRTALRRKMEPAQKCEEEMIERGEVRIDTARHEVTVRGKPVDLTGTEFKLLTVLAKRPGIVFDRYQLVDFVHGPDYPVTDRSVDVQVVGLRKKLGTFGDCIETVRGAGYRFSDKCRRDRGGRS